MAQRFLEKLIASSTHYVFKDFGQILGKPTDWESVIEQYSIARLTTVNSIIDIKLKKKMPVLKFDVETEELLREKGLRCICQLCNCG